MSKSKNEVLKDRDDEDDLDESSGRKLTSKRGNKNKILKEFSKAIIDNSNNAAGSSGYQGSHEDHKDE